MLFVLWLVCSLFAACMFVSGCLFPWSEECVLLFVSYVFLFVCACVCPVWLRRLIEHACCVCVELVRAECACVLRVRSVCVLGVRAYA